MDDLIAFWWARLNEEEATAKAATPGPWEATGEDILTRTEDPHWAAACAANATGADAAHIVLHDPARVLREVAAKRQILDSYKETLADIERAKAAAPQRPIGDTSLLDAEQEEAILRPVVEALTAVWDDHPDYPGH